MQNRLPALALAAALLLCAPLSAAAQETQPGDACAAGELHHMRQSSGPENPGTGYFLVCDGATWKLITEWDTTTGSSLFQVDYDPGACDALKEARLRYTSASKLWEYCDGASWSSLGSGSAAALNDLIDVNILSAADQEVLTYDSASGTWASAPTSATSINALDDVADVNAPVPTAGQVLKWSGSAWIADTDGGGLSLWSDSGAGYIEYGLAGTGIKVESTAAASPTFLGLSDLADHTANQNIQMSGFWLSNDGGNEGVFVDADGEVGIGTAGPIAPLHVSGTNAGGPVTSAIFGNTGGTDGSAARIYLSGNGEAIRAAYIEGVNSEGAGTNNRHSLAFGVNATATEPEERMRIDHYGNVGIGTPSPSSGLHVHRTGVAADFFRISNGASEQPVFTVSTADSGSGGTNFANHAVVYNRNNDSWSGGFAMNFARDNSGNPATVVDDDSLGTISWGGYDGSSYEGAAYITAKVDGTPGTGDMPGKLTFHTRPASANYPQPRMTIDKDGKVGIGTEWPWGKLTIDQSAADTTGLAIDFPSSGSFLVGQWSGTQYWEAGDAHLVIGTSTAHDVAIKAGNGNVVLRVNTAGRVGIGTTPNRVLHIDDDEPVIRLQDTVSGNSAVATVEFYGANGSQLGYVGMAADTNSHTYVRSITGNVFTHGIDGSCFVNTGACASDIRLKQNIETLQGSSLAKLTQISGVQYEWKKNPGDRYYGVIAQEVEKVFPALVREEVGEPDEETGQDGATYKYVNYNGLHAPIIEAIKELKVHNDAQNVEIEALKGENEAMRAENAALKDSIKALEGAVERLDAGLEKMKEQQAATKLGEAAKDARILTLRAELNASRMAAQEALQAVQPVLALEREYQQLKEAYAENRQEVLAMLSEVKDIRARQGGACGLDSIDFDPLKRLQGAGPPQEAWPGVLRPSGLVGSQPAEAMP